MANLFEKKDRHIIPNWRSFKNTAKLGELNGSKSIKLDSSFRPDISDLLDDWEGDKSMGMAGDILGAALVCNQESNQAVREISKYVLKNSELASKAIIQAANNVLKPKSDTIELNFDINSPNLFDDKTNLFEIHAKINGLKRELIKNSINPINWIEIARYYSILGQEKKAEQAIRNALFLSPENRFIIRSAARFFVHIGDHEFAHDIVRKSELTKHDPWLMATEISLATLRERNSRFAKSGFHIVESGGFHPFNITELAGSLATLEMKNSSIKQSKKLFQQSLVKPNDNSLAQAEWASQEDKKLTPINSSNFQLVNSFEALAREHSEQKKWQESIDFSKKWFFDLPFSKMSVLFGNEIASSKLKDHNQAVEIAKLGLISHPNDPQLLNNIIYSLCVQNKMEDAEKYLSSVRKEDMSSNDDSGICLTATKGLYFFRKGYHEMGRQLYLESIKMAKETGSNYLNSLALVNFIREELLLGQEDVTPIIPNIERIAKHYTGRNISEDANEVIELFKRKQLAGNNFDISSTPIT
jgi:tetratricopeptide (TPR) repeat protein